MAISVRQKIVIAAIIFYATFAWAEAAQAAIIKPANNLGLVGYWNLDEAKGTTAYDHGSGAHNGTLTSAPTWTTGKLGGALTFGAANNYVSTGTPWPSSGSISEWVYPTAYADWISPSGWKTDPNTSNDGFILIDNGGNGSPGKWRAVFRPNIGGAAASEVDVVALQNDTLNAWTHLVMTWSLSGTTYTVHLYVNGVDQGSATWTGTPGTNGVGGFHFGNSGTYPDNYFKGKVDDVRVYNRALSLSEVKAFYNQTAGTRYNASASTLGNGSTLMNGLVGWWKFDGSTIGTTIQDSSGQGNNGYIAGGVATSSMKVPGRLGQAMTFNGSSSYIDMGDVQDQTGSFTLSAWINRAGNSAGQASTIIGKEMSSNHQFFLEVQDSDASNANKVRFAIWDVDTTQYSTATIQNAKWYHIVATYDNSTKVKTIYINGVADNTVTGSGSPVANSDTLKIGYSQGTSNSNNYFNGSIDDVRVYNRALSAAEVKQLYQEGSTAVTNIATLSNGTTLNGSGGLVGYWSFNGPDVTDKIYDRSGNNNNGYLSAGTATSSMATAGKSGQGFAWNGSSKYVVIPDNATLDGSNVTVAGWFKFNAGSAYQTMVAKWYTGVQQQFVLQYNSDNLIGWWTGNGSTGGDVLESSTGPIIGYWYFIVATISGTNKKLYINGVLDTSGSGTAVSSAPVELTIGSKKNSGGSYFEPFNGSMDEIRVYNRALSASEVQQLYLMSGGPVTIPPPPTNPGA